MKLEVNKVYSGFIVKHAEYVEEVQSEAYLMEHEKSGARLLYLGNSDDNKVFSISFRTPPYDDTGVPHILEHSSLCGSRKYHLKEPFVELVKGSMNTFLNAMTYPDKTMYPVASRNDKDFKNLMDVYLDAVFYPLIYENPYTLMQEGWHYEIAGKEGELAYNGVVYNEMKGVYSSADAIAENEVMRALFPDSPYRYESGGYPAAIPQLTQEAFENFHRTYYSPENSFIYLYGDMDIEKTLEYLDGEYLSAFEKSGTVNSAIPLQQPFAKTKEVKAFYPAGADEDLAAKTATLKLRWRCAFWKRYFWRATVRRCALLCWKAEFVRMLTGNIPAVYASLFLRLKFPVRKKINVMNLSALFTAPCKNLPLKALIKNFWKPALTCWMVTL